jgi:hypothetical protein
MNGIVQQLPIEHVDNVFVCLYLLLLLSIGFQIIHVNCFIPFQLLIRFNQHHKLVFIFLNESIPILVNDATTIKTNGGRTFVMIDECSRYWFLLETSAVYIFDSFGSYMANFSLGSGSIMDTLITDNYGMYCSDHAVNHSHIIRINPHIQY